MKSKKISFDFDGTLDEELVQAVADVLISLGYEAWIVTARQPDGAPFGYGTTDNSDIWKVCLKLGIPKERVIFMSFVNKAHFFEDKDFIFHLDDDPIEIDSIAEISSIETKAIHKDRRDKKNTWIKECLECVIEIMK